MDAKTAAEDLRLIRDVATRAGERIDPHLFHVVHWGAIVLVWYPLSNRLALRDRLDAMLWVGVGALALGMILSAAGEIRLRGRSRVAASNTMVARQVVWIVYANLGAGAVLSSVADHYGFIPGPMYPSLWGLAYASMAFGFGVVYRREWLVSGLVIFAGAVASIVLPHWNGFILGPTMGLGMIVPGLAAERRVRRMRGESGDD